MKNLSSVSRFVCLCLAATACSTEQPSQQTPAATAALPETASVQSPAPLPAQPAKADSSTPTPSTWDVSESGIGKLKAGMTVKEAKQIVPGLKSSDNLETSECTYAQSPSLPAGVALMFEKGRVARVEVRSGSTRTAEGAGIGESEAKLKSLYGARIKTTPHKYTDGHYLTVTSATDASNKIVFETDGAKVLRFRSGKTPAVEYVEGCS